MAAEGWGEKEICTKGAVGGGVKITPAQSHHYFAKLCSPTNGVSDWCNEAPAVNHKPNVSFGRHSDISFQ